MKFKRTEVWGFEHALRGMRNPKNSWHLNDSGYQEKVVDYDDDLPEYPEMEFVIGPNDMRLATTLIKGGTEHRKFLRQIFVSVDITAPLFWWKEFDTYKVGTTANSTSTMHKVQSKPITLDCFEIDDYNGSLDMIDDINLEVRVECFIDDLEQLRQKYLETKDKRYWKELVRWLPESWLQTRTVTMNYENILSMYFQREFHKLNEWSGKDDDVKINFCSWALSLPYMKEFIEAASKKES